MATVENLSEGTRLYRNQLITIEDLQSFKVELLNEIKELLKGAATPGTKEWLKSSEVRKMLGISPGTLQNLRISGKLPFTKIGRLIFYRHQDITRLLRV
ncbi:helix-turn-helix domain-containing protein [Fulvivirgaceae bacterium PWU4]|uniref:Helix-turn-helix domain-containing protein n=1 Tax=Chryseosolibacter histidini TaxID=2782349 RepID=A0AAP2DL60_9BACT|nr:helix-turn-helix domain-containing protein [Chryseosolibacter histidini]MBT1695909.1 helix-turn-helix domain-containing protein [Chryseosolibacter histidini]